jgi:hypothetical protein
MSEAKQPLPSNSSRIVVIAAVAVLILVAIAGIVLAGRRAPAPDPGAAATASAGTPASSVSTQAAASAPTDGGPAVLVFDAGSDKLPAQSTETIARFADAARASASSVRLSARYLTGENKARDLELAKARTGAIRHALQADGINGGKMQVEMVEMPAGALTPEAGNRVELTLR